MIGLFLVLLHSSTFFMENLALPLLLCYSVQGSTLTTLQLPVSQLSVFLLVT